MERRNIDHVAVSPRAVLPMETKFVRAGRQWKTDTYREAAMDGARSSARSVRSILRSQVFRDVPVEAVLMVWGPGARQLENDWAVVDEVHFVRGVAAADTWRRHCNDGDISTARPRDSTGSSEAIRPRMMPTPERRLVMLTRALASRVRVGLAPGRADVKAAEGEGRFAADRRTFDQVEPVNRRAGFGYPLLDRLTLLGSTAVRDGSSRA